jgi:hypothetical protein
VSLLRERGELRGMDGFAEMIALISVFNSLGVTSILTFPEMEKVNLSEKAYLVPLKYIYLSFIVVQSRFFASRLTLDKTPSSNYEPFLREL